MKCAGSSDGLLRRPRGVDADGISLALLDRERAKHGFGFSARMDTFARLEVRRRRSRRNRRRPEVFGEFFSGEKMGEWGRQ